MLQSFERTVGCPIARRVSVDQTAGRARASQARIGSSFSVLTARVGPPCIRRSTALVCATSIAAQDPVIEQQNKESLMLLFRRVLA